MLLTRLPSKVVFSSVDILKLKLTGSEGEEETPEPSRVFMRTREPFPPPLVFTTATPVA